MTPPPGDDQGRPDSLGREFWLGFLPNESTPDALNLFISGAKATTGTVRVPGLDFQADFSVTPGEVTTVSLPIAAVETSNGVVGDRGIHVVASEEVSVYGLNRQQFTTDAFLGLPVNVLDTEYLVLGWGGSGSGSQLLVVATQDDTQVTFEPGPAHNGAQAATFTMNAGQSWRRRAGSGGDVTGSRISASAPVVVFGSHVCANVPNAQTRFCDHLVDQNPPTSTWGQQFLTVPLATRLNGDTFRILAGTDGTQVTINGAEVTTLDRGQFHQLQISESSIISATQPVLVAQYSNGTSFDGVTSDPFMLTVPPFEQYLDGYVVTTPSEGFAQNFINLVVPSSAVGAVTLNGEPVPAQSYSPISGTGFSAAQLAIELGSQVLDGPLPFGAIVYGFDRDDSYGYAGGLSLAPIAQVASLTLAPKSADRSVGGEHCVVGTVLDQNEDPLEGVRIDFERIGANPGEGFGFTDAEGQAGICYTGPNAGVDTIIGSVGTLSDQAQVTWLEEVIEPRPVSLVAEPIITRAFPAPPFLQPTLTAAARIRDEDTGVPLAAKRIVFSTGGTPFCTVDSDSAGLASCEVVEDLLPVVRAQGYVATFAGDEQFAPASISVSALELEALISDEPPP